VGSTVNENLKNLIYEQNIKGTSDEIINQINDFIKACNNTNIINGYTVFPDNQDSTKFPIFYRPTNPTYQKINAGLSATTNSVEIVNISTIYKGIKLNPAIRGGSGLIYTSGKVGIPTIPTKKVIPQSTWVTQQSTYGALGGDKLFLLSSNSAIPGKGGPINFDNTLYGISPEQFNDEILPKTSSMVRGEQLMELINLIVRFLVTHTHAYPGLPPVPVTQDGTSSTQILTELQNAVTKVLNEYIRIN
jgi:hypothetical protein